MPEIAILVVLVLVVLVVPPLRRAVLSLIGLLAIVAVGSAAFAAAIWGLYQSKPWLTRYQAGVVQETDPSSPPLAPAREDEKKGVTATPETELASSLAGEDEQSLEDERQRAAEEKLRIEIMAARARVILEEDRKLAAQAAAYPLPEGLSETVGDIVAIRIPAWRDQGLASTQKKSIRTWLKSLGLGSDETANIVTAKAWGSLYDMWVGENPGVVPKSPAAGDSGLTFKPPEPKPSPASHPAISAQSESAQGPSPFVLRSQPNREADQSSTGR